MPRNSVISFQLFIKAILLFLMMLSCVACGGSDLVDDGNPDGDVEQDEVLTCRTLTDCPPPLICVDGFCLSADGDVDDSCDSNVDCPTNMKCDTARRICVPVSEDGDFDEFEPELELEPEAEEEIIDGDEDSFEDDIDEEPEIEEEAPPLVVVSFITPDMDDFVDGEITILVDVTSETQVDKVELYALGEIKTAWYGPPYEYLWNTADLEEGVVELRAVAYAGETIETARINVNIDHTLPELTILSPEPDSFYGYFDSLDVTFEVADHLESVQIFVDGVPKAAIIEFPEEEPINQSLLITSFEVGEHRMDVVAVDKVQNHGPVTESLTFFIDDEGPELILTNIEWDPDNPNQGATTAEVPIEVDFSDDSGLRGAYFEIKNSLNQSLLRIDNVNDFPLTVQSISSLLPDTTENYPIEIFVLASATDLFGNERVYETRSVEVRRLRWKYESGANIPFVGFEQTTAPAISTETGNIYITVADEFHGISDSGAPLWQCSAPRLFGTGPVLAEAPGMPTVIITADATAVLYVRVEAEGVDECMTFPIGENLANPSSPALDQILLNDDGFIIPFYFCAQKTTDSYCFHYNMYLDPTESGWELTLDDEPVWTKTFEGKVPPSSPIVPKSDIYTTISVAAGDMVHQLTKSTGERLKFFRFTTLNQKVKSLSANPSGVGINAASDKEFRVLSWNLLSRKSFNFATDINDINIFLPNQAVSDDQATFFVSTRQERFGVVKGVVWAIPIEGFIVGDPMWEFVVDQGLGGTPTIGSDNTLYVADNTSLGRIWALDVYSDPEQGQMREKWSIETREKILAPLVISPTGNLIALSSQLNLFVLDIPGSAPNASTAWPMHQGNPHHTGIYQP